MTGSKSGDKKKTLIKNMLVACRGSEVHAIPVVFGYASLIFLLAHRQSTLFDRYKEIFALVSLVQANALTRMCMLSNVFPLLTTEKGVLTALARAVVLTPPSSGIVLLHFIK